VLLGWEVGDGVLEEMGGCLLVSVDVDVNVGVETLLLVVEALVVETLVLGARVEAVLAAFFKAILTAFFEAVLAAVVGLVDADILFLGEASWAAAVVFSGGDADVLVDVLLVTGRAGLLGWWWLLTFPSSALDRYLLLSLDLFGLLVVFVGRRKDAERDSVGASAGVFVIDRHVCHEANASASLEMDGANARPYGGVLRSAVMCTHGILASKSSLATFGGLGYFARQQRDLQSRGV
jgi:hypothetical protein